MIETAADADRLDLPYPLFVKPIAEGTAKGISARSRVNNPAELRDQCRHLLETYQQPVLAEVFLSGREVTVGITGTGDQARTIGTLEIVLLPQAEGNAYTYVNKERCEDLCKYVLADADTAVRAEELALRTWRGLGCRDAGRVDLRADARGDLHVLEVNPLPGMHPGHSDLPILSAAVGMTYVELIGRIMDSATVRIPRPAFPGARS